MASEVLESAQSSPKSVIEDLSPRPVVLVVDDSPVVRKLMVRAFVARDYNVETATNGREVYA